MKVLMYIFVISFSFFQVSLSFASSKDSINLSFAPDPQTQCHQYAVGVAITENSTLGIVPSYNCADRPTYGTIEKQVTSTFNRLIIPWRYSPNGVFKNGYFVTALVGIEKNKFKTTVGSDANVSFIDTGVLLGYQWFWRNGFNISGLIGVAHLIQYKRDKNISPAESNKVSDYLDEQTSTNTHIGGGVQFGWAF